MKWACRLNIRATAPDPGHIAVVPVEDHPDVADRTILVVGQALDHHRDTARSVPFVDNLLVNHIAQLTRALLDRAFNVGVGHVGRLGRGQSGPEPRIGVGIGDRPSWRQP